MEYKHPRNIFIVDKKYQMNFSSFVVMMFFIPSLVYPISIYALYSMLLEKIESVELVNALQAQEWKFFLILALMHICLCGIIFIICIFQSHKIAGPIYKFKTWLTKIKNEEEVGPLYLRQGDHFPELVDYFKGAIETIERNKKK